MIPHEPDSLYFELLIIGAYDLCCYFHEMHRSLLVVPVTPARAALRLFLLRFHHSLELYLIVEQYVRLDFQMSRYGQFVHFDQSRENCEETVLIA